MTMTNGLQPGTKIRSACKLGAYLTRADAIACKPKFDGMLPRGIEGEVVCPHPTFSGVFIVAFMADGVEIYSPVNPEHIEGL